VDDLPAGPQVPNKTAALLMRSAKAASQDFRWSSNRQASCRLALRKIPA